MCPSGSGTRLQSELRGFDSRHGLWLSDQAQQKEQQADRRRRGGKGGRPVGFGEEKDKRRNEVERTVNALKGFWAMATRYGRRACVLQDTVAVAAIRLRPRP